MTSSANNNNMLFEDTLASIEAMRMQEESGYSVSDYLHHQTSSQSSSAHGPLHPAPPAALLLTEACRSAMIVWCNNLVDFCDYSRETTEIAVSCLDRFISTDVGSRALQDREYFQLAAMTALYTSAKINESRALGSASIAKLTRGKSTKEEIESMELTMLAALQWRVNPPTAMSFARKFIDLVVPSDLRMDDSTRTGIIELVQCQVELAISDYDLSLHKASSIAFAALLNAIDTQDGIRFADYLESNMSSILIEKRLRVIRRLLHDNTVSRQSLKNAAQYPGINNDWHSKYVTTTRSLLGWSLNLYQLYKLWSILKQPVNAYITH
jgi:hypothetical protein